MGFRQRGRRKGQIGAPCRTFPGGRDRRIEKAHQRRIALFQANCASNATGPQARRRCDRQLVGHAQFNLFDTVARTARLIDAIQRHKLEINAMIEQQACHAVTGILDSNRPLAASGHFHKQHVRTDLIAKRNDD
jgi:hypothetical protein